MGLVEYTVGAIKNPEFMKGSGDPGLKLYLVSCDVTLAKGPGGERRSLREFQSPRRAGDKYIGRRLRVSAYKPRARF